MDSYIVKVEADITSGMPYFNMVGLLASEIRESKERIRAALKNIGVDIPIGRITINLSPANVKKEGSGFDLPIAVSLLCIMKLLDYECIRDTVILGELGLDGEVKGIRGILPMVNMARKKGFKKFIIPKKNIHEAIVFDNIEIISLDNIKELLVTDSIEDLFKISSAYRENSDYDKIIVRENSDYIRKERSNDFSDVIGQEAVKRAIMIAVAGWHNLLMTGQPGVGKSMLASGIPGIMPKMTLDERIEVSEIQSICGILEEGLVSVRPFSAPHHTITGSALIGGGNYPKPGEITIAHKGILFLDELPEFNQVVLNSLRQPLEDKVVRIVRNSGSYVFPADCLVVAAMNPCRCGYYPDRNKCNCTEAEVKRYLSKISGPIMDRMDIGIEVSRISNPLEDNHTSEVISSEMMAEIVANAIELQLNRQEGKQNGRLNSNEVVKYCVLDNESAEFMRQAYNRFNLSIRGYYKVLKVARTIADIEESDSIRLEHIMEAVGYRIWGGK